MNLDYCKMLATIALLFGAFGVAQAQNMSTRSGKILNGRVKASGPESFATVGWNYVHATNCTTYFDGSTTWLYVFPLEGGYWFTNNTVHQNTLAPQCSLGNWVAFNVVNASGFWNQVWTFSYK
jgi:hypothetical protein